jgi:hypothetical protein
MSELEKNKSSIIQNIQRLCAHCVTGHQHDCPVKKIAEQVSLIRGIPLIVNDEFRGIIFR